MGALGMQSESIKVFTKNDLQNAIKRKYGKITISGELAKKVFDSLNRDRQVGNNVSGAAVFGGVVATLFGGGIIGIPLLVGGLLGGSLNSINDYKKYRALDAVTGSELTIIRTGSPFDDQASALKKK